MSQEIRPGAVLLRVGIRRLERKDTSRNASEGGNEEIFATGSTYAEALEELLAKLPSGFEFIGVPGIGEITCVLPDGPPAD